MVLSQDTWCCGITHINNNETTALVILGKIGDRPIDYNIDDCTNILYRCQKLGMIGLGQVEQPQTTPCIGHQSQRTL
jgi:hypothetical protein